MASPVDTSVKFAYAEMAGAPLLSGTAGSLISVLDAFLINGFGLKTVDSGSITNGVCRLEFSSGVSCADANTVLLVAGATPAGLNGEQKVTAFSTSWVEFKTSLPDGAVTGAVSFKLAPLGWEKVFSKTNVAVYRPTDPASTRPYFRIDDTGTTFARVTMYETMTDVDTGTNVAPPTSVLAGGYYMWKRNTAVATGAQYVLIGDSRGVYVGPKIGQLVGAGDANGFHPSYFGDLHSYRSGDAYCAMLCCGTSSNTSGGSAYGSVFLAETSSHRTVMRRANGVGTSQTCERLSFGTNTHSGYNGPFGPGPASANNGIFLAPIVVSDGGTFSANGPRGELPGALAASQTGLPAYLGGGIGQLPGSGAYAGKVLLRVQTDTHVNQSSLGTGFFDITGPWREA